MTRSKLIHRLALALLATVAAVLPALGCGNAGPEACPAADARIKECGLPTRGTGYSSFYSTCVDSTQTCVADCVAAAACAELKAYPAYDGKGDDTCPPEDVTGRCAMACTNGCYTPLVLAFEPGPVRFVRGAGAFDLGVGMSVATDWPTAATPWLAIDRNGNGAIDDGSELFGSASPLAGGGRAPDGFAALRALDADGDGWITPADDGWSRLLLWSDRDGDGVSSAGELGTLDGAGVTAIALSYARVPRCDGRGNCEVERARFRYRSAAGAEEREGAVIDVHLRFQTE